FKKIIIMYFLSSRIRHTRSKRDWSSDVCSSDLVPTIFVSGGPMMAGHVHGQKRSLPSMFEAVGAYAAGKMTEEDVQEFENKACPTCGSCSGMYTRSEERRVGKEWGAG